MAGVYGSPSEVITTDGGNVEEVKLTATDVLALINSVDALSPLDTAFNAREALQKAVDLGKSAFLDKATFSAAQRIVIAWAKPPTERPRQITPQQMRAARKLLGWSRERLAAMSDASAWFIMATRIWVKSQQCLLANHRSTA